MKKNTQGFDIAILILSMIAAIAVVSALLEQVNFMFKEAIVPTVLFGSVAGFLWTKKNQSEDKDVKANYNTAIIGLGWLIIAVWVSQAMMLIVGYKEGSIWEPSIITLVLGTGIIAFQINKTKSPNPNVANDILSVLMGLSIVTNWISYYVYNFLWTDKTKPFFGGTGSHFGYLVALGLFGTLIVVLLFIRMKRTRE